MNFTRVPPAWQMPEGVDGPLWQYTQTPRLAAEEDAYFAEHPLFEADARALDDRFVVPGMLVDLGCGAGRHALRFTARSFSVVAVDLSRPMLEMVASKARQSGISPLCVQANLCRLACLPDETFDYALSMFSTLGMIRGRACRRRALAEAARILRRGGRLALHAHNFWLNLRDSGGRSWLRAQAWRALFHRAQVGDRRMDYRGIVGMRVHLYRFGELKKELREAGFRIDEVLPLHDSSSETISARWFLPSIRPGGWIVFARRT
jgi:ubiquinone/menaquinone biosynthesis C-methylase UbiE